MMRRRLRGLGDAPTGTQMQPYGVDASNMPVYIDDQGYVYDQDGNLLFDLSGITTLDAMRNAGVLPSPILYGRASQPSPGSQSGGFMQWLNKPIAPGWFSNGAALTGALCMAAFFSMGGRRRRR